MGGRRLYNSSQGKYHKGWRTGFPISSVNYPGAGIPLPRTSSENSPDPDRDRVYLKTFQKRRPRGAQQPSMPRMPWEGKDETQN